MDENKAIDILRIIAPPRTNKKAFYDFMEARDMAIAALKQTQPKRGKWIHHEGGYSDHYECTACGKAIVLTGRWKFCPNCGADMRGDSE